MIVERSPTGSLNSLQRRTRRTILPLRVLGKESTNSISCGIASGDSRLRMWFMISSSRSSEGSNPGFQGDEGLNDFHVDRIGLGDGGGFRDRRMFQQRRFDFERTDQMAAGVDDIVVAPDEPEVAIGVDGGAVAAQIPAILEFGLVSRFVFPVTADLGGPARSQGDQAGECRICSIGS